MIRLNLGSTAKRREDLKAKAKRLGLSVQIENYGNCSVYRFIQDGSFVQDESVLFSAIGLKEAFCWLNGYFQGFHTCDS